MRHLPARPGVSRQKPKSGRTKVSLTHVLPRIAHWPWPWPRPREVLPFLMLLAAIGMIGRTIWSEQQLRVGRADAAASQMATAAAQTVARSFEQFDRAPLAIIYQHQSLAVRDQDVQSRTAPFFEALRHEACFAFVGILNKHGQAIAGMPRNANDWSDRDYFSGLEHLESAEFSAIFWQPVTYAHSRRATAR
jgi:hypothetical protein